MGNKARRLQKIAERNANSSAENEQPDGPEFAEEVTYEFDNSSVLIGLTDDGYEPLDIESGSGPPGYIEIFDADLYSTIDNQIETDDLETDNSVNSVQPSSVLNTEENVNSSTLTNLDNQIQTSDSSVFETNRSVDTESITELSVLESQTDASDIVNTNVSNNTELNDEISLDTKINLSLIANVQNPETINSNETEANTNNELDIVTDNLNNEQIFISKELNESANDLNDEDFTLNNISIQTPFNENTKETVIVTNDANKVDPKNDGSQIVESSELPIFSSGIIFEQQLVNETTINLMEDNNLNIDNKEGTLDKSEFQTNTVLNQIDNNFSSEDNTSKKDSETISSQFASDLAELERLKAPEDLFDDEEDGQYSREFVVKEQEVVSDKDIQDGEILLQEYGPRLFPPEISQVEELNNNLTEVNESDSADNTLSEQNIIETGITNTISIQNDTTNITFLENKGTDVSSNVNQATDRTIDNNIITEINPLNGVTTLLNNNDGDSNSGNTSRIKINESNNETVNNSVIATSTAIQNDTNNIPFSENKVTDNSSNVSQISTDVNIDNNIMNEVNPLNAVATLLNNNDGESNISDASRIIINESNNESNSLTNLINSNANNNDGESIISNASRNTIVESNNESNSSTNLINSNGNNNDGESNISNASRNTIDESNNASNSSTNLINLNANNNDDESNISKASRNTIDESNNASNSSTNIINSNANNNDGESNISNASRNTIDESNNASNSSTNLINLIAKNNDDESNISNASRNTNGESNNASNSSTNLINLIAKNNDDESNISNASRNTNGESNNASNSSTNLINSNGNNNDDESNISDASRIIINEFKNASNSSTNLINSNINSNIQFDSNVTLDDSSDVVQANTFNGTENNNPSESDINVENNILERVVDIFPNNTNLTSDLTETVNDSGTNEFLPWADPININTVNNNLIQTENNSERDKNDGESLEGERWEGWLSEGNMGLAQTPPEGRFSSQNSGPVKFEAPRVPVIFVLGGPGSGKVTHCDNLMTERKGITHINMTDLLQQYTISENKDFSQLSSKTVTEVLMLEMKMSPAAKTFLISGYPRSMRDVVEYSNKIQIVNGVVLVAWRQKVLERQIEYGAKLGHVVLSMAKIELQNFFKNVMPVADYFDQRGMLIAVNGERNPGEVYIDFRTAILRILGSREGGENGKEIVAINGAANGTAKPVTVASVYKPPPNNYPLVIWVIGGPGSNKYTLCHKVSRRIGGWLHLSVGRLLRAAAEVKDPMQAAEAGLIKAHVAAGNLVPQDVILQLIDTQMNSNTQVQGILIDSFPRNIDQVKQFEEKYNQEPVLILLDCSKLQLGRGRMDDSVSSFRRRLELFREHTLPMLKMLDEQNRLQIVEGDTDSQEVREQFMKTVLDEVERLRRANGITEVEQGPLQDLENMLQDLEQQDEDIKEVGRNVAAFNPHIPGITIRNDKQAKDYPIDPMRNAF